MGIPVKGAITADDVFRVNGAVASPVTLVNGAWVKVGEMINPSGLIRSLGYGQSMAQSDAVGRMFFKLMTAASVEITGRLRIQIYSPQDRPLIVLGEWHSNNLNQNMTDRTKWMPFSEMQDATSKDFKFVFEFKADASAAAAAVAQSVIYIDTTEQLLS